MGIPKSECPDRADEQIVLFAMQHHATRYQTGGGQEHNQTEDITLVDPLIWIRLRIQITEQEN